MVTTAGQEAKLIGAQVGPALMSAGLTTKIISAGGEADDRAPANWSRNVLLWNLAADPFSGPHTSNGGCPGCTELLPRKGTG